eukprot:m.378902 g.378902  ORF g.378902 m.378902 type:complete len:83 (+) comp16708_c5_seq15:834-1082(+)
MGKGRGCQSCGSTATEAGPADVTEQFPPPPEDESWPALTIPKLSDLTTGSLVTIPHLIQGGMKSNLKDLFYVRAPKVTLSTN